MGIFKATADAAGGVFADQWKDVITSDAFDEQTVVAPGVLKNENRNRGTNYYGSENVLSNGSKIFVPENTAAFVFSQSGIEEVIVEPGGYEYQSGQDSLLNGNSFKSSIMKQVKDRIGYGGITADEKRVAFVNLREIRNIRFGTRGPLMYNDLYYGADLEVVAYGSFTIKVLDPVVFVRNFIPANTDSYSFSDKRARAQIIAEFMQSFIVALNSMSDTYRITQLPSRATEISRRISQDESNAGTWSSRFGFGIIQVALENIEFTESSRELVKEFSSNKMSLNAFAETTQRASDIAAQQKIAQGIQDNGLGDGGGMIFSMNLAQGLSSSTGASAALSIDQQIEAVKKLKELLDGGVLTEDQFEAKKREIMGF